MLTDKTNFKDALEKADTLSDMNIFITYAVYTKPTTGRLAGMLLAIKDNIHVVDIPNTAGTDALMNFIPTEDAPAIARIKAEGGIILGKTNMHEMAYGITSNNFKFGPVKNPYDPLRFAGGSSGGSAAAVSARIVQAAIGTDTGGSIRLPAALCGIIGFRPSLNRYPSGGVTPVSSSRDTIGPMALNMDDITLLDSVMANRPQIIEAADLSKLRLGIVRDKFFQNLHPDIALLMKEVFDTLKKAQVTFVEFEMPEVFELTEKIAGPLALYETVRDLPKYLEDNNIKLDFLGLISKIQSPDVKALFNQFAEYQNSRGKPKGIIPKDVYEAVIHQYRPQLKSALRQHFAAQNIDALIFPTTILPAGPIKDTLDTVDHNSEQLPTFATYIQNTDPGSSVGMPGISLPIGLTKKGLPVGMELEGLMGEDETLLAIAIAIEPLLKKIPAPNI